MRGPRRRHQFAPGTAYDEHVTGSDPLILIDHDFPLFTMINNELPLFTMIIYKNDFSITECETLAENSGRASASNVQQHLSCNRQLGGLVIATISTFPTNHIASADGAVTCVMPLSEQAGALGSWKLPSSSIPKHDHTRVVPLGLHF